MATSFAQQKKYHPPQSKEGEGQQLVARQLFRPWTARSSNSSYLVRLVPGFPSMQSSSQPPRSEMSPPLREVNFSLLARGVFEESDPFTWKEKVGNWSQCSSFVLERRDHEIQVMWFVLYLDFRPCSRPRGLPAVRCLLHSAKSTSLC
ncbi:hypothetical protein ACLB2K_066862 [Fragaria x ananassa]